MKHDESHERKQNAVLRLLASAIADVADHAGHSGHKKLVATVNAMLDSDEGEAPDPSFAPVDQAPAPTPDPPEAA